MPEVGKKQKKQPRVSVVIPALNEEATIAEIVKAVRAVDKSYEVIVVDDGSTDRTEAEASGAGARVIRNPYNIGNGASVKRGCLAARGDVVVMLDADGQHPPEAIPQLVEHIGAFDLCIGSRTRQSTTSRIRNLGNHLLNAIATWIAGQKVEDLTSGFRAFKKPVLYEYLHIFPRRYSYPTTTTMAMILGNHFVKYVPIHAITKRRHGMSNIKPVEDFLRFINIMLRLLILFRPQKFFLPLSLIAFVMGVVWALYQMFLTGGLRGTSLVLILSSVIFFCFGLLAEQIAELRRQHRPEVETPRDAG